MPRQTSTALLILSNGHGEDAIGAALIRRLQEPAGGARIDACPLIGPGSAYGQTDCGIMDAPAFHPPSAGFGTLSAAAFWRDLRAGWLSTQWRQWCAVRRLSGRYDLAVAIGDIVPMLAARATGLPLVHVGCAKSAYYAGPYGYNRIELGLLRRHASAVFVRDHPTAVLMRNARVPVTGIGNPLLDLLDPEAPVLVLPRPIIGVLPGSRSDADQRISELLDLVMAPWNGNGAGIGASWVFAIAPGVAPETLRELAARSCACQPGWRITRGNPGRIDLASDRSIIRLDGNAFGSVLASADAVLGLAGSANEQAASKGVPVVTYATAGTYGRPYVRMKQQLFGDALLVTDGTLHGVRSALDRVLTDAELRQRMAQAGRERMGPAGILPVISETVQRLLRDRGSAR